MKQYEKEILDAEIKDEKEVLKALKEHYKNSISQIGLKIDALEKRMKVEETQSLIYRLDYQKALKTEIQGILDLLTAEEYETISDYLNNCYNNSFLGTMYSLQQQGIPIILPIDQEQVINAIVHQTKLSETLYTTLGHNMNDLKKRISSEVSRGISNNLPYGEIARNISNTASIGLNKAVRIARTEGHRIQGQAQLDAAKKAKSKGAKVVKQWDSTLDGRTRKSHRKLDGQIRDVDEYFEVDGKKALTAGQFNRADEDINCRCRVNQRAIWGLDEDELKELQKRAEYFGLDKTKDFDDFRKKYLEATKE
jgi:SPP1 gp7 family putative phage head morphogenesis protein